MARYKIEVCYDGTNYYGYQKQDNLPTIQGVLEDVFSKRFQENIITQASGRTDAGVHAIAQVVHFDTDKEFDTNSFGYSINTMLPKDIAVTSCQRVDDDFHARFSVKKKTYLYKICLSKIHSPLKRMYYHLCYYDIDLQKMREACKYFIGEHDFRAFMLANDQKENTVREIYDLHIDSKDDEIYIYVTGNGFLHNMVRIIAGTLIDVGRGRFEPHDIIKMIESKKHVRTGKTLEACGLYLYKVEY